MSSYKLAVFLLETVRENGLTVTEVAKRAKLSRESVYKLLRGVSGSPASPRSCV